MKTLLPVVLSLLLVKPVHATDWFQSNTPLTQAHQHLLEDDLGGMFNSLVELWQSEPNKELRPRTLMTCSLNHYQKTVENL